MPRCIQYSHGNDSLRGWIWAIGKQFRHSQRDGRAGVAARCMPRRAPIGLIRAGNETTGPVVSGRHGRLYAGSGSGYPHGDPTLTAIGRTGPFPGPGPVPAITEAVNDEVLTE